MRCCRCGKTDILRPGGKAIPLCPDCFFMLRDTNIVKQGEIHYLSFGEIQSRVDQLNNKIKKRGTSL